MTGTPEQQPSKWGLSEAELFLSKGAPTEGMGLGGEAMEPGSEAIVTRRLAIGVGITVLAVGLAFVSTLVSCCSPVVVLSALKYYSMAYIS